MKEFKSELLGRESLILKQVELSNGECKYTIQGVGGLPFLAELNQSRETLDKANSNEDLESICSDIRNASTFALMFREVILKALGKWKLPFEDDELCHCRMVPTEVVTASIVAGAHKPARVSRETNASTQCGTCRPDVEKMIAYRLGLHKAQIAGCARRKLYE